MGIWEKLHPYRAAHAMKLHHAAIRADPAQTLRDLFAPLQMPSSFATHPRPLRETIEHALNTPRLPGSAPICGFASPDRDGIWLTLAYDHRLFDSVSARHVMCALRERLAGHSASLPPFATTALRNVSPSGLATSAIAYVRFRSAWRTPVSDPLDFRVAWHQRSLPADLFPALRKTCHARHITVGDAFLAAIAIAVGATSAPLRTSIRRHSLGLAVAADIHARDPENKPTLGLALGWFPVLIRPEQHADFWSLAASIATQSRALKNPRNLAASASGLAAALGLTRVSRSPRGIATWFQRAMPFAAALSSVNLTASWADTPEILDYIRASPAGPLTPAVFTPTTRSATASIAITYRTTAISADTAKVWLASVEESLRHALIA